MLLVHKCCVCLPLRQQQHGGPTTCRSPHTCRVPAAHNAHTLNAENFKFSRLVMQAWLQSAPELVLLGVILYRNASPGGPAVVVPAHILFQVRAGGKQRAVLALQHATPSPPHINTRHCCCSMPHATGAGCAPAQLH